MVGLVIIPASLERLWTSVHWLAKKKKPRTDQRYLFWLTLMKLDLRESPAPLLLHIVQGLFLNVCECFVCNACNAQLENVESRGLVASLPLCRTHNPL